MPASFVAADTYYDAGTAWPTSLTLSGAPTGTATGDRLYLVVLAYGTNSTLDNWNLSGDWTLVDSVEGTQSGGGTRSSLHCYTARHNSGAPLPATISPRTAGGALIAAPRATSWYRAHLWSMTPSYPIYEAGVPLEQQVILGRGNTTANQPDDWDGGYSAPAGSYIVQFTAILNPVTRTLGTVYGTAPVGQPFVDRWDHVLSFAPRGGDARIADVVTTAPFSGGASARYPLGGTLGAINVRAINIAHAADPDPPLPRDGGIYMFDGLHLS